MLLRSVTFLCALSVEAAAAAPQASIEMLAHIDIAGETVSLGQVANLRTTDLALMRKLVDLPIGRAPRPGQELLVDRSQLSTWIQGRGGIGAEALEWSGAGETRVVRKVSLLRGEEIANAAALALEKILAASGVTHSAQPAWIPRDMHLPAGELRLQPRTQHDVKLRNRALVWVEVWVGASFIRAVAVPFELTRSGVLPTRTPAPSVPNEKPIAASPREALAVSRGEWAAMRAGAGAVVLESRVEVLQDGRTGDKVRVRHSGAAGMVFARVISAGQLELAP